jgi:hypothetical protein
MTEITILRAPAARPRGTDMKPVMQTIVARNQGNCWSACIASLLELPIEEVPPFVKDGGENFLQLAQDWLGKRGLFILRIRMPKEILTGDDIRWHQIPECLCIATGKSPRGDYGHAVVGRIVDAYKFEMLHDPHPDGTGIEGFPICVEFLVPLDPARL